MTKRSDNIRKIILTDIIVVVMYTYIDTYIYQYSHESPTDRKKVMRRIMYPVFISLDNRFLSNVIILSFSEINYQIRIM